MGRLVGYLITFTTYCTWLHGRGQGAVNGEHNRYGEPFLHENPCWEGKERQQLRDGPFVMDGDIREVALRTVREVSEHRRWTLYAGHVRSNHIHVITQSHEKPEKIMTDMKAWLTRRLRESFDGLGGRRLWTRHGSTKYLWDHDSLVAAMNYVVNGQGEPMSVYDNRQSLKRERQDWNL